jgi:hypothetical protein
MDSSSIEHDASQSTPPRDAARSRYTCPDCHRHYQAKETLQRHRKNHSRQVEHICEVCEAGFVRRDLLLRHYRIHQGDDPNGNLSRDRQRSRHACDRCSRLKIKCSSLLPACSNCQQRNATCNYSAYHATRATAPRLDSTNANPPRQTNPQTKSPKNRPTMDDSLNPDVAGMLPRMVLFKDAVATT